MEELRHGEQAGQEHPAQTVQLREPSKQELQTVHEDPQAKQCNLQQGECYSPSPPSPPSKKRLITPKARPKKLQELLKQRACSVASRVSPVAASCSPLKSSSLGFEATSSCSFFSSMKAAALQLEEEQVSRCTTPAREAQHQTQQQQHQWREQHHPLHEQQQQDPSRSSVLPQEKEQHTQQQQQRSECPEEQGLISKAPSTAKLGGGVPSEATFDYSSKDGNHPQCHVSGNQLPTRSSPQMQQQQQRYEVQEQGAQQRHGEQYQQEKQNGTQWYQEQQAHPHEHQRQQKQQEQQGQQQQQVENIACAGRTFAEVLAAAGIDASQPAETNTSAITSQEDNRRTLRSRSSSRSRPLSRLAAAGRGRALQHQPRQDMREKGSGKEHLNMDSSKLTAASDDTFHPSFCFSRDCLPNSSSSSLHVAANASLLAKTSTGLESAAVTTCSDSAGPGSAPVGGGSASAAVAGPAVAAAALAESKKRTDSAFGNQNAEVVKKRSRAFPSQEQQEKREASSAVVSCASSLAETALTTATDSSVCTSAIKNAFSLVNEEAQLLPERRHLDTTAAISSPAVMPSVAARTESQNLSIGADENSEEQHAVYSDNDNSRPLTRSSSTATSSSSTGDVHSSSKDSSGNHNDTKKDLDSSRMEMRSTPAAAALDSGTSSRGNTGPTSPLDGRQQEEINTSSISLQETAQDEECVSLPLDKRLRSSIVKQRLHGCEELLQHLTTEPQLQCMSIFQVHIHPILDKLLSDTNPLVFAKLIDVLLAYLRAATSAHCSKRKEEVAEEADGECHAQGEGNSTLLLNVTETLRLLEQISGACLQQALPNGRSTAAGTELLSLLASIHPTVLSKLVAAVFASNKKLLAERKGNVAQLKGGAIRQVCSSLMLLLHLLEEFQLPTVIAAGGLQELLQQGITPFCCCSDKKTRTAAAQAAAHAAFLTAASDMLGEATARHLLSEATNTSKGMQTDALALFDEKMQHQKKQEAKQQQQQQESMGKQQLDRDEGLGGMSVSKGSARRKFFLDDYDGARARSSNTAAAAAGLSTSSSNGGRGSSGSSFSLLVSQVPQEPEKDILKQICQSGNWMRRAAEGLDGATAATGTVGAARPGRAANAAAAGGGSSRTATTAAAIERGCNTSNDGEKAAWKVKLHAWQQLEGALASCSRVQKKTGVLPALLAVLHRCLLLEPTLPVISGCLRVLQLLTQKLLLPVETSANDFASAALTCGTEIRGAAGEGEEGVIANGGSLDLYAVLAASASGDNTHAAVRIPPSEQQQQQQPRQLPGGSHHQQQHLQQQLQHQLKQLLPAVTAKLKVNNRQVQGAATNCLHAYFAALPIDIAAAEVLPFKEKLPNYRQTLLEALTSAVRTPGAAGGYRSMSSSAETPQQEQQQCAGSLSPHHHQQHKSFSTLSSSSALQRALPLLLDAAKAGADDGASGVRTAALHLLGAIRHVAGPAAIDLVFSKLTEQKKQQIIHFANTAAVHPSSASAHIATATARPATGAAHPTTAAARPATAAAPRRTTEESTTTATEERGQLAAATSHGSIRFNGSRKAARKQRILSSEASALSGMNLREDAGEEVASAVLLLLLRLLNNLERAPHKMITFACLWQQAPSSGSHSSNQPALTVEVVAVIEQQLPSHRAAATPGARSHLIQCGCLLL